MLTEKDYCDYETCVTLRELGYNYPQRLIPDYFGVFNEPQYDEKIYLYDAQKWLREEKNIHIEIPIWLTDDGVWKYNFRIQMKEFYDRAVGEWDSYEEALSESIKYSINILKENETIH